MYRDVMTTNKIFSARNGGEYHSDPSNLKLIVGAIIISIALIVVSIALDAGIDPEVARFASP